MPRYRNRLYAFPFAIVIAAVLAVGVIGGLSKHVSTVKTLDAALTAYQGVVIAADTYVTDCAEKIIDQACVPTARAVAAQVKQTEAAYDAVKAAGANPPATVAATLIAAVNVLQAALPQN